MTAQRVGVIGTGAMGGGVVQSLLRAGFATVARDILGSAQDRAVSHGAIPASSPADLARSCATVIILVVDAAQIEGVLFGSDGAAAALSSGSVVLVGSTVDPAYPAALAPRLAARGVALLDAPVSGGPAKAAAGTMTMMLSGDSAAIEHVHPLLARITGRLFVLGTRCGEASTFKIVNNLLAAANLAAAAEAMALARAAGLDLRKAFEVINACSGASWIFTDRAARALDGDYAPRAAAKILAKDVRIAVELARRCGVEAPVAHVAEATFADVLAAGYGDADDAILLAHAQEKSAR